MALTQVQGGMILASGQSIPSAALPVGSVLQVVNATYATEISTTSTSFVTSNITASITPKFATSKILIIATDPVQSNGGTSVGVTLFRGTVAGTNLFGSAGFGYIGGSTYSPVASVTYLDSPATTSATTYTVGFKSIGGSTVWSTVSGATGSITLMEIAA
jgi:hypothetical protein